MHCAFYACALCFTLWKRTLVIRYYYLQIIPIPQYSLYWSPVMTDAVYFTICYYSVGYFCKFRFSGHDILVDCVKLDYTYGFERNFIYTSSYLCFLGSRLLMTMSELWYHFDLKNRYSVAFCNDSLCCSTGTIIKKFQVFKFSGIVIAAVSIGKYDCWLVTYIKDAAFILPSLKDLVMANFTNWNINAATGFPCFQLWKALYSKRCQYTEFAYLGFHSISAQNFVPNQSCCLTILNWSEYPDIQSEHNHHQFLLINVVLRIIIHKNVCSLWYLSATVSFKSQNLKSFSIIRVNVCSATSDLSSITALSQEVLQRSGTTM